METSSEPHDINERSSLLNGGLAGGIDRIMEDKAENKKQEAVISSSTFASGFVGSPSSSTYFWEEYNSRNGGLRSIVARSEFGMSTVGNDISMPDIRFVTETARFCHTLSRGQREDFARILRMTVAKTIQDNSRNNVKRPWKVAIPTTMLHIRQNITDYSDAFLNLLPMPRVESIGSIGSKFAYISLREIVQNFLAFGYELVKYSQNHDGKVTQIVDCLHCRRRYKEIQAMYSVPVLVLWIIEWSDGYDPHSFSKANRGSAWTKVITFVPPHNKTNSIEYTYPVALGLSSGNRDVVESKFRDELLELSDATCLKNVFYSATHKGFIRVHVELLVSLMDQPERRSATSISRGNSNVASRWGYSVSLNDVQHKLVPCSDCAKKLLSGDRDWDKSSCTKCEQWKIIHGSTQLKWKKPEDFPSDECEGDMLVPMKLSFDLLKNAVTKTANNVTNGTWSKKQAEEYLAYFCVQKTFANEIIRRYENIRVLGIASANLDQDHQEYANVMEMVLEDEEAFTPVDTPPLWSRGASLNQHIDVLMHLVFLGAVDGTLKFIHVWLKKQSKYSSFMRLASTRLNVIQKLNLKWCKAMPYKGNKLGGWVSENYLAFARVCKWFFLILDNVGRDEEEYVEPTKPQNKWTKKENTGWLKIRGLDTKGNALELRTRVATLQQKEGGPPPVLEPCGGTIDDVFNLVSAMFLMVRSVMVKSCGNDEVKEAERCIKLFLTRLVQFEKLMITDGNKARWISSYTFPCLLNIPDIMREFGPMRNYWEGGIKGEGFLRFLKPEHGTIGIRQSWEKMVMERVVRKKILAVIAGGTTSADWEESQNVSYDEKEEQDHSYATREFFKYPSVAAVYKSYFDSVPLSIVRTVCGRIGMVTRTNSIILLKPTEPTRMLELRGMWFANLKIDEQFIRENDKIVDMTLDSVQLESAFLLLPHPNQKNFYYGVDSHWNERDYIES